MMNAGQSVCLAIPAKLRQPISEITKGRANGDREQTEGGDRDASTGMNLVQQEHQSSHRSKGDREQRDANCHVASVDHVAESTTRAKMPIPKPRKKPTAVALSISLSERPANTAP